MIKTTSLQPGDIVQCSPDSHWPGLLVIITEAHDWGVKGYSPLPRQSLIPLRMPWQHFDKVGRALWTEIVIQEVPL